MNRLFATRMTLAALFLAGGILMTTDSAAAQGRVGAGEAPRTTREIKRNLKTILVVKSVNADTLTIEARDEITNEDLTYTVTRSARIATEKGFPLIGRGKEVSLADLKPGQRLEVVYRESLPTQLTKITLLKPKEPKKP